ncbi:hypothetical protein FUAX_37350 [Fulvitalea axinellae]|uniref:VanZ-like domain-containing protein n=1 Tax=Fulvitalea axinellae TaxID=1182444 RepID=A0AAU9D5M1_9BACT|nr:hypothetical protein FUAX_37350 [Fulvitalea axinellae]
MFFRYNLYTIIWALVILLLTMLPGEHFPRPMKLDFFQFDKVAHAGIFCVLTMLMIVGFKKQGKYQVLRYRAIPYTVGITLAYGLAIELLQSAVPGRGFEYLDLLANALGVLIGCVAFRLIYRI